MRQRLVLDKQKDGGDKICGFLAISTHKTTDSKVTATCISLHCMAAWLGSVPLSGASKTLGVGYLCSQMAQGFSAAKAKVVFEGHCGFGDFRDQWDAGMAGTAGRERHVCLCPCCLMGFLAIPTCPSAFSLRHG